MKRHLISLTIVLYGLLYQGSAQNGPASSLQDSTLPQAIHQRIYLKGGTTILGKIRQLDDQHIVFINDADGKEYTMPASMVEKIERVGTEASQTPAPEPAAAAAPAVSTPAPQEKNPHSCKKNWYYIDNECRSAYEVATAGNVWFDATIVPSFLVAIPSFIYLNQIALKKERRYLDKLDIKDGRKLYKATRIMNYACLGEIVLFAAIGAASSEAYRSGDGPAAEVAIYYVTYYTTAVLHCVCNGSQRRLLRSAVGEVDRDNKSNSQKEKPLVAPYVSIGPSKKVLAGLALRF